MTDRYTHTQLHDKRAALENLPDLALPSSEKEKVIKTGTNDAAEILPSSCFSGGERRTSTDCNGLTNPNNPPQK